jgi:hypothetical protein
MIEVDSKHLQNVGNTAYNIKAPTFRNKLLISTEFPGEPETF